MLIKYESLSHFAKLVIISVLAGILSGVAASLFLHSLRIATQFRESHEWIIWLLPLAGFFIGLLYHHYGKDVAGGNNLILEEIHDPKKKVSINMAFFIYIGTVITHLFGGSAGREGTAVQMSASLADQLSTFFRLSSVERRAVLVLGAGSGFGAAIGAPIAGIIFGMEVIYVGRLQLFAVVECAIASFVGFYVTVLLSAPHTYYSQWGAAPFSILLVLYSISGGVLFGLTARIFSKSTHFLEHFFSRIPYPPLKPFIGGVLVVILFHLDGSYIYDGLGLDTIMYSFSFPVDLLIPLKKMGFTSVTIASGFKGGEFIPLVFIGTTLGSALGGILGESANLLVPLGFAAVFAGASNTPLTCTIMAMELFGWEIGPYAFISCYASYFFSGSRGIYKSQKIIRHKNHWFNI